MTRNWLSLWFGVALVCLCLAAQPATAQEVQVKPWFLVIVDTSTSMLDPAPANSCGYASTKEGGARCALYNLMNSQGDAEFGLMQFDELSNCQGGVCNPTADAGEMLVGITDDNQYDIIDYVDNLGGCGDELTAGTFNYTPLEGSLTLARDYFCDNSTGASPPCDSAPSPFNVSPTTDDIYAGCRPVSVILLTDGDETCCVEGGSFSCDSPPPGTVDAVEDLRDTRVPFPFAPGYVDLDIRTYVIGFGNEIDPGDTDIEAYADAGGTDAPGPYLGFYAQDEDELFAAFSAIIADSQLLEVCNGVDDDCDYEIDESFPEEGQLCREDEEGTLLDLCDAPGSEDDEPCGTCGFGGWTCSGGELVCSGAQGPVAETCDCEDNDCDGDVDEGTGGDQCWEPGATALECAGDSSCSDTLCDLECLGATVPTDEYCDNVDNDCDGETDELPLSDPTWGDTCGIDRGICTEGNVVCIAGELECSGQLPEDEICDGLDNDCDGLTDNVVDWCTLAIPAGDGWCDPGEDCGECRPGYEECVGGEFDGECHGEVAPRLEICDGRDNDCDGYTDESDADPDEPLTRVCGTDVGLCETGIEECIGPPELWGSCEGEVGPDTEVCDGEDNNCNGEVDENASGPCNDTGGDLCAILSGEFEACGVCQAGEYACVEVSTDNWEIQCVGAIGPSSPDYCDGWDNDCDGDTDEDEEERSCGSDEGICVSGTQDCEGADGTPAWSAVCDGEVGPGLEICDNLDNNCDGVTDESFPEEDLGCRKLPPANGWDDPDIALCTATGSDPAVACGACQAGYWYCSASGVLSCLGTIGPDSQDLCDGLDNDCDGDTDEDEEFRTCGTDEGECTSGTQDCEGVGGVPAWAEECVGAEGPFTEDCDGLDNNCDGRTDEVYTGQGEKCSTDEEGDPVDLCDAPGSSDDEPCGECEKGDLVCVPLPGGGAEVQCRGTVGMTDEICDGDDNDCDGLTDADDEDMADNDTRLGGVCGSNIGRCEPGTWGCQGGNVVCVNTEGPFPEVCNALDDDCDYVIDETVDLEVNEPGEIGVPCREVCQITAPYECENVLDDIMEVCSRSDPDHPDDDAYDEPCGACRRGATACVQLEVDEGDPPEATYQCVGVVGPGVEICDGIDNDCDGLTDTEDDDMDDERVGQLCPDDVTGECTQGTSACVDGEIVCQGGQQPEAEICDGRDNDCDGVTDEGMRPGTACWPDPDNTEGECEPGQWICDPETGEEVCFGGTAPIDEVCDGLDNDCDGQIDEGLQLGDECGTDEGVCETGIEQCIDGEIICVGGVPPGREVCDCLDNDCDGETDEEDEGPLCPEPAICLGEPHCQCAAPCSRAQEFSNVCPEGKTQLLISEGCYCIKDVCDQDACAQETVERDGETRCRPDSDELAACVCKANECTFVCDGMVCSQGLICDPRDGRCREQSCVIFGCEDDEYCDATTGECEEDACASVDCEADEACREGTCFKSCADVACDVGERCVDGECDTDPCADASCESWEVCDPSSGDCIDDLCAEVSCARGFVCEISTGECEADPCLKTNCPQGQVCRDGGCVYRCPEGRIACEGTCIDPRSDGDYCGARADCRDANAGERCAENQVCADGVCTTECGEDLVQCGNDCIDPTTDREHCGASGDCQGDNAGAQCAEDEVCANGECSSECPDGQIRCGYTCVDPDTDDGFCGATDDCVGENAGVACEDGEACVQGKCVAEREEVEPEVVVPEDGDPHERITAMGGGGCACTVTPGSSGPESMSGAWALLLGLLGAIGLRRKRIASWRPHRGLVSAVAKAMVLALALGALALTSGCKVNPFCLDCGDAGEQQGGAGGGEDGAGTGGGSLVGDAGPGGPPSGRRDSAVPGDAEVTGDAACLEYERCNGVDDDCDGEIDEDFDLNTNANHCGSCEIDCARPHALYACVDGECIVGDCDLAYHDLDMEEDNGCEYYCLPDADDDSVCDLRDNDCDGQTDEDVDKQTDPLNCDDCGFVCRFGHAREGGSCVNGTCVLDDSKCDEGFHNIDGNDANGCEYQCTPTDPPEEVCDLVDNDCDGDIDEGDPGGGAVCGGADGEGDETGECVAGVETCATGSIVCEGSVGPDTEICDGKDNDCDGETDEDITGVGTDYACDSTDTDSCADGQKLCVENSDGDYEVVCLEDGIEAAPLDDVELCDGIDNDCNGQVDEGNPQGGAACQHVWDADEGVWVSVDLCPGTEDDTDDVCGACSAGTWQCGLGGLFCDGTVVPQDGEVCDGIDNDCDGETDEGIPNVGPSYPCDGGDDDDCEDGYWTCTKVGDEFQIVCSDNAASVEEVCNGQDDDCDGLTDEEYEGKDDPCNNSGQDLCASESDPMAACGVCRVGSLTCVEVEEDVWSVECVGTIPPGTEICDGWDNDCDSYTDEDPSDPAETMTLPCGTDLGLCVQGTRTCIGSGGRPAWGGCVGATDPGTEVCDGWDNDCDGATDETDDNIGETCRKAAPDNGWEDPNVDVCTVGDPTIPCGECSTGTWQCLAGELRCIGVVVPNTIDPDICDGLDTNCNNQTDEDEDEKECGQDLGECNKGTRACVGANGVPIWGDCLGETDPVTEVCDGVDNDCDGLTDESHEEDDLLGTSCRKLPPDNGEGGADVDLCDAPGSGPDDACGQCSHGEWYCVDGDLECLGTQGPTDELCNSADDDCDGVNDNGFVPYDDVNTCGDCDTVCDELENAFATCDNPGSGYQCYYDCWPGFMDDPTQGGEDCLLECTPTTDPGEEECNGVDDDCDTYTDESADLSEPAAADACITRGVCGTGVDDIDVDCEGADGWQCDYSGVANYQANETRCDGYDNDCDGKTDETFPYLGSPCWEGIGECRDEGVWECASTSTTQCTATEGGSEPEVCNGLDDDCDGETDEPCANPWTDDDDCVTDAWALVSTGGSNVYMYAYEASRPDSDDVDQGGLGTRACSSAGVMPWTNITYTDAMTACANAIEGGRLCTDEEFEDACENGASCDWSFRTDCQSYPGKEAWCNGLDSGYSAVLPTGDVPGDDCYRGHGGVDVYDLSGNVKEWTTGDDSPTINPLRGGAMNNTRIGISCTFDKTLAYPTDSFFNWGFRCCVDP